MPDSFDVVVMGAGIVGAACALECAQAGLKVAIVEQGIVGGGATAAAMGHIVAMDDSEAQFMLTRYSQQLWLTLKGELPDEVEFETTGTIWVAADEQEMIEVRRKHTYYSERRAPCEILDPKALEEAEPNLRKGLAGGLLVSEDAVLYPPTAAHWLWSRAQRCGVAALERKVIAIRGAAVDFSDGSSLNTGLTVIATGTWLPELDGDLEIKKRKGHLAITDRYPGFIRHQLVELGYLKSAHSITSDSVAFNVQPRATGQILIGSSRQYGAEDSDIDRSVMHSMLARACVYLPALTHTTVVRCWTGFRAATPDKLPLIGPSTRKQNVWYACGHEGLGITTSLGTAKLLVDQILGRPPAIPFAPYLPSRQLREHAYA
ncbi:MAG TPA: FAD-dependent oxidoreductase [Terriglobales bacterium]|nr:FAD-dependent oxidoreductase [Terriglobales bacterium]